MEYFIKRFSNSADPDQTESSLSESTLFAGHSKVTEWKFINIDTLISSFKYFIWHIINKVYSFDGAYLTLFSQYTVIQASKCFSYTYISVTL